MVTVGRPSDFEQRQRRRAFWRHLADTRSVVEAQKAAGLSGPQLVAMLDEAGALEAVLGLVEGEAA